MWGMKRRQELQVKIDLAVRHRYRHVLADLDATEAELSSLAVNGYTLTPTEMQDRISRFRAALLTDPDKPAPKLGPVARMFNGDVSAILPSQVKR